MRFLSDTVRVAILTVLAFILFFGLFFAPDLDMAGHLHYMTRSACLLYRPWMIAVYGVSDLSTFLSYLFISFTLFALAFGPRARQDFRYNIARKVLTWMGLFMAICAINHLCEVVLLWYPIYDGFAFVKVGLALVSAYTALFVIREVEGIVVMPKGLASRAAEELRELLDTPSTNTQANIALLQRVIAILNPAGGQARQEPPK